MALFMCLMFLILPSCRKDEFDKGSLISSNAIEKPGKVKIKNEVIDIDRNVYQTVKIGQRVWMAENLKVTRLNNGTLIPEVTDNTEWYWWRQPGLCWYNNDGFSYKLIYGALYNWYTVNTGLLCPEGWHVPSEAEWQDLSNYLGGADIAGGKLKEVGTIYWNSPNVGATDEYGFKALPGGSRTSRGEFIDIRLAARWWSSSEFNSMNSIARSVHYSTAGMTNPIRYNMEGLSVRCIENTNNVHVPTVTTAEVTSISQTSALSGGNITDDGGLKITARGICWSTSPDPNVDLSTKTLDGIETGRFTSSISGLSPGTTYYLRAYATNPLGTSYGGEISFKTYYSDAIRDIEGNSYNIVTIGNQVWMAENLKTTTLYDGTKISEIKDWAEWVNTTDPAFCWYENDNENYGKTYGPLYNWYSVKTGKLCPTGWHIPSDEEWYQLALYLDQNAIQWPGSYGIGNQSLIAGGMLKEIGTLHWLSPNTDATNITGFTAFAGGIRYFNNYNFPISFFDFGEQGAFWSDTEYLFNNKIPVLWIRLLSWDSGIFVRNCEDENGGLSIRCLKD
jgi:uncharacterized protein (TIGR02145 family)